MTLAMRRKHFAKSKRLLQICVAIGGLVPVSAGMAGIIMGPSMITGAVAPLPLDSHYRYLSGLLLGIGFGFWSCIPKIEHRTERVQLLAAIVVIGGLGRVTSLWAAGVPDVPMQLALVMELVITPLLALWQYTISKT
jgi:hypothetical protein